MRLAVVEVAELVGGKTEAAVFCRNSVSACCGFSVGILWLAAFLEGTLLPKQWGWVDTSTAFASVREALEENPHSFWQFLGGALSGAEHISVVLFQKRLGALR